MKLQLYVLRTISTRIIVAAIVLMSILQMLDLLDVTPDILERGLGLGGVAYYAVMRVPRLFEQVAPIAVLAGGLFAFSQLARESAVVAMRASGVSGYRIIGMAIPAVVVVMLLNALCTQVLAPRAEPILAEWWRNTEALLRLEALWRAWEHLRLDPATGMSDWLRDHADPQLAALMDREGPFMYSTDHNNPGEPLPYTAPPPGLFPDVREPQP